jgi:hypothetical protein
MKNAVIENTDSLTNAEDVLAHRRLIGEAKSEVARIQPALDKQNKLIAQACETIPNPIDRNQERNNIMADIALGNASPKALRAIDDLIAQETAEAAKAKEAVSSTITSAQATAAGLKIKLDTAQEALKAINQKTADVAYQYFMREAQVAAAQYVNHALSLKMLYIRIYGLNTLIASHDGKGVLRHGNNIQIPKFNLPQFDSVESFPKTEPGMLVNGFFFNYSNDFQLATSKDKERFDALLYGHETKIK